MCSYFLKAFRLQNISHSFEQNLTPSKLTLTTIIGKITVISRNTQPLISESLDRSRSYDKFNNIRHVTNILTVT